MSSFIQKLPTDTKRLINDYLTVRESRNFRSTNKENRTLPPILPSYFINNDKFITAYKSSLFLASKKQRSLISKTQIPELKDLMAYYSNIYEDISRKDYLKVQLFNKGILIYLQIIDKEYNDHYIFGLAQLISEKSGLVDVFGINGVKKYRLIEFELYKLYIMRYILKPSKKYNIKSLRDAVYMIKYYSENGIPGYVKKATPTQLLWATFLNYYFNNTDSTREEFNKLYSLTKNPIIDIRKSKDDILQQYAEFMIKCGDRLKSVFLETSNNSNLSLIDENQDYKKLYLSNIS